MIVEVVMPKMGESITEGTILEWRKKVGDTIKKDEILLEIGTDKVDSEIPSAYSGILSEILAEPNEVVAVGTIIAKIETVASAATGKKGESEDAPTVQKKKPLTVEIRSKPQISTGKSFFTPVVLKIAREAGISLSTLETLSGSGKSGRLTKKDLLAFIESGLPVRESVSATSGTLSPVIGPGGERVEMDRLRKLIAEHMRKSLDTSAHVFVMTEVDMTPIVNYVSQAGKEFKKREGFGLTYTPFILDAVAKALQQYPEMNASIEETTIVYHKNINIGLAVAVENGLMVPVIRQCEELNFLGLCRQVYDHAVRTREKQINPDELQGSTFSVTNFGVFNVTVGTPIINQPNVGILGIGAIKKRPAVIEGPSGDSIGIKSMMVLSLGFDHRLIDGAGGSRFIDQIRQNLENMDLGKLM